MASDTPTDDRQMILDLLEQKNFIVEWVTHADRQHSYTYQKGVADPDNFGRDELPAEAAQALVADGVVEQLRHGHNDTTDWIIYAPV